MQARYTQCKFLTFTSLSYLSPQTQLTTYAKFAYDMS